MNKKPNKPEEPQTSPVDTSEETPVQEQTATDTPASEADTTTENPTEKAAEADISVEDITTVEDALKVIAALQLSLREAREKEKEAQNQALRLQADFINFRKRKEKELGERIRFANEDVFKELLPVLDNFERTLQAIEKTDNLSSIKDGIKTVDKSMKRQLSKAGLEGFDAKDKEFDSNLHEAVTTVPVPDDKQKGKVIDQIERGYKLKDKVIRYAKVVVGE